MVNQPNPDKESDVYHTTHNKKGSTHKLNKEQADVHLSRTYNPIAN